MVGPWATIDFRLDLQRGLLADSSTTSYNLQPSLVMPVEILERAVAIVDEAIAGVTA